VPQQRNAVSLEQAASLAQVLQGDRLAAAAVVGDRDDAEGHVAGQPLAPGLGPPGVDAAQDAAGRGASAARALVYTCAIA
jgi:hypothetical protein